MPQNETCNAILAVNSNSILVVAVVLPRNYYPRSDITVPSLSENQKANIVHTIAAYQNGKET
jgi:hypothetical protein